MKVIGIGDNVCDQYAHSRMMYPGGQAMNFSVYAKMLGADSAYMGVFGEDNVADHVIRTLDEFGIDRSHCRQYPGENGYARIQIVNGDRQFLFSNRGGIVNEHPLELNEEDLKYISGFDLVHTSNNSHFNSQLPKLRSLDVPVSYDYSGRMWQSTEFVEATAPYIDFAFLSAVDKDAAKDAVERIHELGCRVVVVTLGSEGALVSFDGHEITHQPERLPAVDTLGAGDSFATGFLLSVIEHGITEDTILQAMLEGEKMAAKTVMVEGAYGHGVPFEL